jgi:NAD(P)-dependent dehydrogenase (short-subunit alcohol dehydrogenase family)
VHIHEARRAHHRSLWRIGEATARRLAIEPAAELVTVARRDDRLRRLAASPRAPASHLAADFTDADAPQRITAHISASRGRAPVTEAVAAPARSSHDFDAGRTAAHCRGRTKGAAVRDVPRVVGIA